MVIGHDTHTHTHTHTQATTTTTTTKRMMLARVAKKGSCLTMPGARVAAARAHQGRAQQVRCYAEVPVNKGE